jgi:hypothetical protein
MIFGLATVSKAVAFLFRAGQHIHKFLSGDVEKEVVA